jgi:hypothetical protein
MLAHCVNPDCYASLRSFSEGRLFQFEVVSISIAANDEAAAPFDEKPERQTAHFWLCGRCADNMTLVLEPMRGLKIVPLSASAGSTSEVTDIPVENIEFGHTNSC